MKGTVQRASEFVKPSKYLKQPKFEDKLLRIGPQFSHSWANMAHMHDLRVWTLTYAPGKKNNIQRLQEIHMLNNEMWYGVYRALWQRVLIAIPLWFFITRVAKHRYVKNFNVDSHDASFRDTTAHM
jgi:hypothetical protein